MLTIRHVAIIAFVCALALPLHAAEPGEGQDLIGRRAPPFTVDSWLTGKAPDTAGKVVLVRMWTVGCFNCRDSAPALTKLAKTYGPQGLVVVGIHHPKSARGHDDQVALAEARAWGMDFHLAQDRAWRTVNSWWLTRKRRFTSASILVDGRGVIRHLHPGGALHESSAPNHAACHQAYAEMDEAIRKLLSERMIATR